MFIKSWSIIQRIFGFFWQRLLSAKEVIGGKANVVKGTLRVFHKKSVVAIEFSGDLGSQLFQWAAARKIFKNQNMIFLADTSDFNFFNRNRLSICDLGIDVSSHASVFFLKKLSLYWSPIFEIISLSRWPHKISEDTVQDINRLRNSGNYLVAGYWRDQSIVEGVRDELLKDIQLPPLPDKLSKLLACVRQDPIFILPDQAWVQDKDIMDWYGRASGACQRHDLVVLQLRPQTILSASRCIDLSGYSEATQLHFISKLNHIFLSPSFIGWWGAWFNEFCYKKVFFPSDWNRLSGEPSVYCLKSWQDY